MGYNGTNAPWGLQPRKHINGSVWNGQTQTFTVQDSYATSLFTGDPVTLSGGYLVIATAGSGNPVMGVFLGCLYTTATGTVTFAPYWPASTATFGSKGAVAYVCIDQTVLYDTQCNNSSGLAATVVGNNAPLVSGSGSTVTGQSGWTFGTPVTGTATNQVKIIELVPNPLNAYSQAYNNWYVMINNNLLGSGTGTGGV